MVRVNRLLTVLVLAALLLSACQPIVRPAESQAAPLERHGLRPDTPPYGVRGPYMVGARDYVINEGGDTVFVTAWYPALNSTGAKEEIAYAINEALPLVAALPAAPTHTVKGQAIADAALDTAHGPYPLVIYSPGLAAWRQANSYLGEHLASYGFVVLAADTRGESLDEFWQGAVTRPIDTTRLIALADKLTAAEGEFAGLIDTEHIAIAGHSSGGWTSLAGGGAQMNLSWCTANPELVAQYELSNCPMFVSHQDQIATMRGLASTPTGLWPATNDPRVDAVFAMAPDGDIWGANYEGVAVMKVPTLVLDGSNDTITIPKNATPLIYEHLGSAEKGMVIFQNGDHMIFFNQCRDTPWMATPDWLWACADPVWDMDRVHDLINHFAAAFMLAELKGDGEAAKALAAENVTFPGVQYETTGFGK